MEMRWGRVGLCISRSRSSNMRSIVACQICHYAPALRRPSCRRLDPSPLISPLAPIDLVLLGPTVADSAPARALHRGSMDACSLGHMSDPRPYFGQSGVPQRESGAAKGRDGARCGPVGRGEKGLEPPIPLTWVVVPESLAAALKQRDPSGKFDCPATLEGSRGATAAWAQSRGRGDLLGLRPVSAKATREAGGVRRSGARYPRGSSRRAPLRPATASDRRRIAPRP